jgi:hypothetical protein
MGRAKGFAFPIAEKGLSPEKAVTILLCVVLAAAGGGHWFAFGRDQLFYLEFYDRLGLATNIADERFEIGFTAGAWIFKMILGLPYAVYASVLVGFALTVKFACFYRYCDRPLLACLVYCASFYPLHEYTQIRIAVGLAFGMLGCLASTRGRLVEAAAWIGIGALFHTSEALLALGVGIAVLIRLPWQTAFFGLFAASATVYLVFPSDPISFLETTIPNSAFYLAGTVEFIPNLFSSSNLVTVLSILACLPMALTSRDRVVELTFIMCILATAFFVLLIDIPAFAFRFREVFAIFGLILIYRRSETLLVQLAGFVVALVSIYQLAAAIQDGII